MGAPGGRPASVRAVLGRDPGLPAVGAGRGRGGPDHGRGADRDPRAPRRCWPCSSCATTPSAATGTWSIVDCAPTAETLRLLALPEALGLVHDPRLRRTAPDGPGAAPGADACRRSADAGGLRVRGRSSGCTRDLEQVQQILTEKDSTVRLVLTPETVVVAEARRSLTTLSLYGYRVDGVIANRVFPAGRGRRVARGLGRVPAAGARRGPPVVRRPADLARRATAPDEPVGSDALAGFAETAYDGADPLAVPTRGGAADDHPHQHRGRPADRAPVRPGRRTSTSPATVTSWS